MVVGLRLRLRTIGQRHGEHSERTAQSGNGHHSVDAQGWNDPCAFWWALPSF